MTWGRATFANSLDHTAIASRVIFLSRGHADTFGPAPITEAKPKPSALPPLILSAPMQRHALILDRDKAAHRMDTRAVHRIEVELRRLTSRMLKAACSDTQGRTT
jgi:hypothetical protein